MSNFNLLYTQEDMSSTNKGSVTESKIQGIKNTNWTRETKFLKGPLPHPQNKKIPECNCKAVLKPCISNKNWRQDSVIPEKYQRAHRGLQ